MDFATHGIRFTYPDSWTLSDESSEEKVHITAQSPGTAFWSLIAFHEDVSSEQILGLVETAYRDDYPSADIYPQTTLEGPFGETRQARIEFVCLDLIANVTALAFHTSHQSVMVLTQSADIEEESVAPLFAAMTASLEFDGTEESTWVDDLFSP